MQYNSDTKTLNISYEFNEELKNIPEDTKIIIFQNEYPYSKFNQKVDNLSKSLTHLTFGCYFNQKVDNLPQSLTHLTFGNGFNQKVDNLPQSLTHLTFAFCFNQKADNLPQSLTHLTFGRLFNQKVDNLPNSLTYLTFCSEFYQKINNLPKSLTHLTFGVLFSEKLVNLPKNLSYLKLGWYFQNEIILPKKLKELSLTCNNDLINNIPEYIEKIYIYFSDSKEINKKVENLPFTLKEIIIENENENYKEYIKIPFGCILTIQKIE